MTSQKFSPFKLERNFRVLTNFRCLLTSQKCLAGALLRFLGGSLADARLVGPRRVTILTPGMMTNYYKLHQFIRVPSTGGEMGGGQNKLTSYNVMTDRS